MSTHDANTGEGRTSERGAWPSLPLNAWKDTYATLHMWTQIVGKVRMALTPKVNHWWHVPLYVSARGLTTSPIPYGDQQFEIEFDLVAHELRIAMSDGSGRRLPLRAQSVAAFYREVMALLGELHIQVRIMTKPVEVPNPIRFTEDEQHASYDPEAVQRLFRILVETDAVFKEFRGRFIGKNSPVHFFWGAFDLAVTRFSGRRAPKRDNVDAVTEEAYSHEVISHGFWPGGDWPGAGAIESPVYYAYSVPEPDGFKQAPVRPRPAFYSPQLSEFLLPYDEVRSAASPRQALLDFMQSTYDAGADLARWNRAELERTEP
jgi:hypothetical protein